MQGSQAKREVLSDQAKLSRLGRQTPPPAKGRFFGQVTTSRRKDSEHAARESGRGVRSLSPDVRHCAAKQQKKDDLLNQLQRLQLLQQEAQELLL